MTQLWTAPFIKQFSGHWASDYPREPDANRRPETQIPGAIEMQIHIRYIPSTSTSPGDTYFKSFNFQCKFTMGKYWAPKSQRSSLLLKVYSYYPAFCPPRTRKTLDLYGCIHRVAKMPCVTSSYTSVWAVFKCPKRCSLWLSIVFSGRRVLLFQSFSPCSLIYSPYWYLMI